MGFINKIKNFFYDEEEVEEEVVPKKVEHVKRKKEIIKDDKEDISERELFRAERTFNFPINVDEEDFTPVKKCINEESTANTNIKVEPKEYRAKQNNEVRRPYSYVKPAPKEQKKFKPTPVISPIFGILDEDYKADLTANNLEETKEFNMTRKVTFDEIHKKAYGTPNVVNENFEEDEKSKDDVKGLFFNLKDDKEEDNNIVDDDIKITYNDVDYDSENDEEIEVPKISRIKKNNVEKQDEESEDDILSENKEDDLFNLIDNMYNSDDEEEDE